MEAGTGTLAGVGIDDGCPVNARAAADGEIGLGSVDGADEVGLPRVFNDGVVGKAEVGEA